MENKQQLIDALAYPPTHTYVLDGLKPTGVLAERFAVLKGLVPDFFNANNSFLDVGCNKGFFSLYGSQFFNEVVGIDNTPEFIDLCTKLKRPNTEFILTDFRNYTPSKRFDRILLGNVHHYLFRSCQGWDWLYKLAAISKGLVVIEGPVDMSCPDMSDVLCGDLREHFNYEEFIEVMNKFFVLKSKTPTVGYTPGRHVIVF
ncbi:MAG: class I SAM-dependent methyltransferase, partial [Planctomycetota bacterium]